MKFGMCVGMFNEKIYKRKKHCVRNISEISAVCLGRMQYFLHALMWEFHISEISAICLGRMQCLWEFQISVFVGVSHIGDIGDMFGAYAGFTREEGYF